MSNAGVTYQTYLKNILLDRTRKNPAFSMRAMARLVGVQPSLLSEVMNGRRHLTEEAAVMIAQKLGLDEKERLYFRALVQLGRSKNPEVKQLLLKQIQELYPRKATHELSVDQFVAIADWYHFAMLRLLDIEGFSFNASSIAAALGIHVYEAEAAIERLDRLEIIEKDTKGQYRKVKDNLLVQSFAMNDALRKYHKQMLEKTSDALTTDGPNKRFTGTENIVLSSDQLNTAIKIFEECFQKILDLSEKRKKDAEVFHLGIHMIRISKIRKMQMKGKANEHPKQIESDSPGSGVGGSRGKPRASRR